MKINKTIATAVIAIAGATFLTGCDADASDVASHNISKDADNFRVERRIVFLNGITDKNLLSIEGLCSIADQGTQLEVTCKTGDNEYKKHFLGLSDNVTYFAEHMEASNVDEYHYKVIFRPETIAPSIEMDTSANG